MYMAYKCINIYIYYIFLDSRLMHTMMTGRKKRGVEHYDHGYDNDHAAGFPSIEGALMAISFLTFAVYLIRLVMVINQVFYY